MLETHQEIDHRQRCRCPKERKKHRGREADAAQKRQTQRQRKRSAGIDSQQPGIRQRIARHPLHDRTGGSKRCPYKHTAQSARKTQLINDNLSLVCQIWRSQRLPDFFQRHLRTSKDKGKCRSNDDCGTSPCDKHPKSFLHGALPTYAAKPRKNSRKISNCAFKVIGSRCMKAT